MIKFYIRNQVYNVERDELDESVVVYLHKLTEFFVPVKWICLKKNHGFHCIIKLYFTANSLKWLLWQKRKREAVWFF